MSIEKAASRTTMVLGTLIALVVGGRAIVTAQFNPQPDPPGHYFGIVGLTDGQVAELHVANVANPRDPRHPPDPCRAELMFIDQFGRQVAASRARIAGGQSESLTFMMPGRAGGATSVGRLGVRGAVQFMGKHRFCVSSVEVRDSETSASSLFLNPMVIRGFNPQPDPPGTPALPGGVGPGGR